MFELRLIRDDPDAFRAGWSRRDASLADQVDEILDADRAVREAVSEKQAAEARRNAASKEGGAARARGDMARFEALKDEATAAKQTIEDAGARESAAKERLNSVLLGLPNLPMGDVPDGQDESQNVEVSRWGRPASFDFAAKDHVELGAQLGGMDFETAAKMSGARFVLLQGAVARLERALAAFMLDLQTQEHGFVEVSPPVLVKREALIGTGQLPKFGEESYETTDGRWLTATSEITLANTARERVIAEVDLPIHLAAHTPCFRSEAGSAGRDTRGMIRLHQFNKVELVSLVASEDEGLAELERMTRCAETVLERLGLPYRRMLLCAGDMGFGARKTFDLEVWLPGQDCYREISSCSYCGDFQARRMQARWRPAETRDRPNPKPEFIHTLNGSGLAVGRTLVAVLENYQNADGSITIPPALVGHMGGVEVLQP
ncbi:MAG: serine--tRNA ligase [Pseudomonadota bacterium]